MSFSVYFVDLLMCCLLIICIEKHYKHYKSDTFFCFIIFLYLYQLVAEFIRSIFPNAPYGFVFHFALMQNETKDQGCAICPTRQGLKS